MTIRTIVTIPAVSGIPKDAVTNTWYIEPTETRDPGEWLADLHDFYEAWSSYRSLLHDWDGAHVKLYDMDDPVGPGIHREAFAVGLLGLTATAAASTLPSECALCLSFKGMTSYPTPQARGRGRVYLGTFGAVASDSSTGRPNTSLVTALVTAATDLRAASVASSMYDWVVYSGTTGASPGTHTDHGSSYVVEGGWVDNAWDTQRRRGLALTGKSYFS